MPHRILNVSRQITAARRGCLMFGWLRRLFDKGEMLPAPAPAVPCLRRSGPMRLSAEKLKEVADVTAADIEHVLAENSFGDFAILSASDDDFIQVACNWNPVVVLASDHDSLQVARNCALSEEAGDLFSRRHDSWALEYRDGTTGMQFKARRDLTLVQVKEAFLSYLRGDRAWHDAHTWEELEI